MTLLAFLIACSSSEDPVTQPTGEDFEAVFRAAGDFEPVAEGLSEEPVGDTTVTSDENFYCTQQTYSRSEGRADQPVFNPAAGVLYPGNLVQGEPLVNGELRPIPVERGGGTIVIDLVNGSGTPGVEIEEVNFLEAQTAMNTIIADTPNDLPARTRYSMQQVRSAEELAVAIGVDFETIGFALEGEFNYESSSEYNRYVVKLTQEYYTLVYDLPTSLDEVFADSVTPADLETYVQPGNPAAFVHSVTYGRMFYLLIQSTDSVQEMSASIDASFAAVTASGSLSADAEYISELSNLSIGGWAEGGDATLAAGALQGDFEALSDFIENGGTITTGVPLSYVVRSVNRPDLVLNIGRADEYTVSECVPVGASLSSPIFWYDADTGVDTVYDSVVGLSGIERWNDLFSDGDDFDAVSPDLPFAGYILGDAVNGRGATAMLQPNANSGGVLGFPGSPFRDEDFTIFAVLENPHDPYQVMDSEEHYFMWSPTTGPQQGIHLGFQGTDVVFSMGEGQTLIAPAADDRLATYFVFTFRFSRAEGMSIYQNGVLLGENALTAPLVSFNSASLGTADADRYTYPPQRVNMANIQAYALAATETQRRYIEDSLIERYGL